MVKPILGIFLFSFVFIAGAYFVLSSGNKPPISIPKYVSQDKDKPIIEAKETIYDMGCQVPRFSRPLSITCNLNA